MAVGTFGGFADGGWIVEGVVGWVEGEDEFPFEDSFGGSGVCHVFVIVVVVIVVKCDIGDGIAFQVGAFFQEAFCGGHGVDDEASCQGLIITIIGLLHYYRI